MGRKFQILLVEDEKIMQQYLSSFIDWDAIGFQICHIAANGRLAVDYLSSNPPKAVDIILTDIRIPVMGGLELAQVAKSLFPKIKVILISAYSDFSYARKGLECGIYNYLLKSDEEESIREYFQRLYRLLVSEQGAEGPETPADTPKKYSAVLESCMEFIGKNYAANIGLREVAEYVHVHPQHICRVFAQELNKGFNDVLTEKRLEISKVFLRNTNLKIYEIAEIIGYHKTTYYSELFKKYYGLTPKEYRNHL